MKSVEERLTAIEEILASLLKMVKKHRWEMITSSMSGMWQCAKCGKAVDGGPHDGGGYYPGRGQEVSDCEGGF